MPVPGSAAATDIVATVDMDTVEATAIAEGTGLGTVAVTVEGIVAAMPVEHVALAAVVEHVDSAVAAEHVGLVAAAASTAVVEADTANTRSGM